MKIVPYKSFWLGLSTFVVIASVVIISLFGFNLSADFTEGSLYEISFQDVVSSEEEALETPSGETVPNEVVTLLSLQETITSFAPADDRPEIGSVNVQVVSDERFILRSKRLEEVDATAFMSHLRTELGDFETLQIRDVSPVFAETFRNKALLALGAAIIMIILYITFAFRGVSRGIKSWKLGVAAIAALVHDVLIIMAIFVLLGAYYGAEVDALFITALLSVMGFSVNDTIVVFDRLRENMFIKGHAESFNQVAEKSLHQTLGRSVNTSVSTLIVLASILILGSQEIFYFVLALLLGVLVGTYSSIFLATPLLTVLRRKDS